MFGELILYISSSNTLLYMNLYLYATFSGDKEFPEKQPYNILLLL